MSENQPEQDQPDTQQTEPETPDSNDGDTNVEADQVVVNQAPDGGGVDNNDSETDSE